MHGDVTAKKVSERSLTGNTKIKFAERATENSVSSVAYDLIEKNHSLKPIEARAAAAMIVKRGVSGAEALTLVKKIKL